MNILYVDDLIELNHNYVLVLETETNFKVTVIDTPEKALTILKSDYPPDCVVLDIDMPVSRNMDSELKKCWRKLAEPENSYGLALAEWMADYRPSIPVIFLSAVPDRLNAFENRDFYKFPSLDRLFVSPDDLVDAIYNLNKKGDK